MNRKVLVKCAECGKEEYVAPSRAKKYCCCSKECLGKYNSKRYAKRVFLTCPICGKEYNCKKSSIAHHKTCGNSNCRTEWLKKTRTGKGNPNFRKIEIDFKKKSINEKQHSYSKTEYLHVVKEVLGLQSVKSIPNGYVTHHKDGNHMNNSPENLVLLPKNVHFLIHKNFGNVLIKALHTNKITKEVFYSCCDDIEKEFYKNIIDLNITNQAVVKQGELLENSEVDNQQPSIYRNIIEGSTTNSRVLTDNAEDSNANTSALPVIVNSDDIV